MLSNIKFNNFIVIIFSQFYYLAHKDVPWDLQIVKTDIKGTIKDNGENYIL